MDPRRRFNASERAALYLAADGRCSNPECGVELEPGWHSDHIDPHSQGGPTDVINGQALCPPCNLKKGNRVPNAPRGWQAEALQRFIPHPSSSFLVTATPGAGKTRFALAAARELLDAEVIQRVVVVCPTSHLRGQWKDAAHKHYGIELDPGFKNGNGAVATDMDGPVVTYASVARQPKLYRKFVSDRPSMVILDEVHHAGTAEHLSWGDALLEAFEPAQRRLLLSGTPFRSDGHPIPFVRYLPGEDGVPRSQADYAYGYGKALNDGVVRPIAFNAWDGKAKWRDAGVVFEGTLNDQDEELSKKALRTALHPDGEWMPSVLRSANADLTRVRVAVPDAGGLVVAYNQDAARAYCKILAGICGEEPALAISDEPDASGVIERFADGTSRWLVAVQMVSEGVDIPRLAVGVYASKTLAPLFFRQVVGRFVRTREDEDEMCSALFVPSVPVLLAYAAEIEQERDHALVEAVEKAKQESAERRQMSLDLDMFEVVTSGEATHHATILAGESYGDAELVRARQVREQAGIRSSISDAEIARLIRLIGPAAASRDAEPPDAPPAPSVADEKKALRKLLASKVGRFCRLTETEFGKVHGSMNDMFGDVVGTATVETLNKRLQTIDQWLRLQ